MTSIAGFPIEILQNIVSFARPDLKTLWNIGLSCRSFYAASLHPNSQYWRNVRDRAEIVVLKGETTKGAVLRFFQETLACVHAATKHWDEGFVDTPTKRIFRWALTQNSLGLKYDAAMEILRVCSAQPSWGIALEAIRQCHFPVLKYLRPQISEEEGYNIYLGAAIKQCPRYFYMDQATQYYSLAIQLIDLLKPLSPKQAEVVLLTAIEVGCLSFVDFILKSGFPFQCSLSQVITQACLHGSLPIVKRVLEDQTTPEAIDGLKLIEAVGANDLEKVISLLQTRDISTQFRGYAFIFACATYCRWNLIQMLMEDQEFDEIIQENAFCAAVQKGDYSLMRNLRTVLPLPYYLLSALMGRAVLTSSIDIFSDLIPGFEQEDLCWLLPMAVEHRFPLDLLLQQPIPLHILNQAILIAAENGEQATLVHLLRARAKKGQSHFIGFELEVAAANGHLECVTLILERGGAVHPTEIENALEAARAGNYKAVIEHLEIINIKT